MVTVLYADLLFLINLLSDFLVLYLTSRFSGARSSPLRLIAASSIGAIFGTAAECAELHGAILFLLLLMFANIICFAAFGKRSLVSFIHIVFYFYFSSILLFGGATAVYYISEMLQAVPMQSKGFILTVIFILSGFLIFIISTQLSARAARVSDDRVSVEICDGCKIYELELYRDSGSLARDPFSGKPVTVIKRSSVDPMLYSALSEKLCGDGGDSCYRHIRPRVIPIKTVSGTTLLYAFVPKSMYICDRHGKHPVDSIVAIDTHENAFFGKDGVIPGSLVDMI